MRTLVKEGRILETAVDHCAQDDAGNVWYCGEDVSNHEDAVVVDKEGTWLAGRGGPPGMIMPAETEVGDEATIRTIRDRIG